MLVLIQGMNILVSQILGALFDFLSSAHITESSLGYQHNTRVFCEFSKLNIYDNGVFMLSGHEGFFLSI